MKYSTSTPSLSTRTPAITTVAGQRHVKVDWLHQSVVFLSLIQAGGENKIVDNLMGYKGVSRHVARFIVQHLGRRSRPASGRHRHGDRKSRIRQPL
jgi:hypothetical protein